MIRTLTILSASLLAFGGAHAGDLRTMMRQPGEWEVTMSGGPMPTTTQKGCYAGDTSVTDLANKNMKDCGRKSVNLSADLATVDAVCQLQGLEVTVQPARPRSTATVTSRSQASAGYRACPATSP